MSGNNKTDHIGDVITIYSSWKAHHPLSLEQSKIVEQKLHSKYRSTKTTEESTIQTLNRKQQLHQIQFKSKELIPFEFSNSLEDSPKGRLDRESENIRLMSRKASNRIPFSRFQSVDFTAVQKTSSQKILHLNFRKTRIKSNKDTIVTTSSPRSIHKQFRLKKTTSFRQTSPLRSKKIQSPRQKAVNIERFCKSSRQEKNNFLKGMIQSDLDILRSMCQIDMEQFVVKIKREEMIRKARALNCWFHFNYSQLEE